MKCNKVKYNKMRCAYVYMLHKATFFQTLVIHYKFLDLEPFPHTISTNVYFIFFFKQIYLKYKCTYLKSNYQDFWILGQIVRVLEVPIHS